MQFDIKEEIEYYNEIGKKRRESISKINMAEYLRKISGKKTWWGRFIKDFKGKRVLDIGCGTEDDLIPQLIMSGNSVVATDLSPESVKTTKMLLEHLGLKAGLVCSDIQNLPFKSKFDVVHAKWVLHHVQSIPTAIKNIKSVIKPGGILLLPETNYLYPIRWLIQTKKFESINIFRKLALKYGLDPNERARTHWYYIKELKDSGFEIRKVDFEDEFMFFWWFIQSITKNTAANRLAKNVDKLLLCLRFPKYFGMQYKIIAIAK